MFSSTKNSVFFRQTWALTKKNLLIAAVRHWFSTLIRAVVLPIAFIVLLVNIRNFAFKSNAHGVGIPLPVRSLVDSIPTSKKLVIVQPPGLGSDVSKVVSTITTPLNSSQNVVYANDNSDLVTLCSEGFKGVSECFAAVVFYDSPLTIGGSGIWNYTIRFDSAMNGVQFDYKSHSNDPQSIMLPFQVAIDNAITNSTIIPNEYLFTSVSQKTADDDSRRTFQKLIVSTYGIAFFITMVSLVYHVVGMITSERESGMTQLIDAMGGSAGARICSYILAFDIMYLPSWIVFGFVFRAQVYSTSSAAILILWQVFTGLSITGASVFTAMFFNRAQLSGVYCVMGFLIIAVVGQIINHSNVGTAETAILSLLFPSMNYMFFIGYLGRYEGQQRATDLVHAAPATSTQSSASTVPGIVLWFFLWLQIVVYPLLALLIEKWLHGSESRGRSIGLPSDQAITSTAIKISGLSKIYPPALWTKLIMRGKSADVVAVDNLDLVAQRGQILCLLGANGSGKTTTLDMIGGLQKPSKGSIQVNAMPSQLGICPQRNVLWDDLTVDEHLRVWNGIKHSQASEPELLTLVEACDLTIKQHAQSRTLSGGQKRKLQLACMFVGGSTVCLLDEVSSGLDPLSRRGLWNIILAERSKRTMVLTTHFLDEADVLADNIAIISLGLLKCEGSAVELKTRLGGGYRVHLPGTTQGPEMGFPTKRLWDQTVYNTTDSRQAATLISKLEAQGYSDVFVNGPTVEDVFLRVAQESHANRAEREIDVEYDPDDNSNNNQFTKSRTVTNQELKLSSGQDISFYKQARVMFLKRFTILKGSWIPTFIAFAMAIVVAPALQTLIKTYKADNCHEVNNPSKVEPFNLLFFDSVIGNLQLLAGPLSLNETLHNAISRYPIGLGLAMTNYTTQFVFEDSFSSFQNHVSHLYANVTPGALYMDSNTSAPTYGWVGDLGVQPPMIMQNLWTQLRTGLPIAASYTPFDAPSGTRAGNSIQWITYFCLSQAVYPAFFALYPTFERLGNIRALQYSNGVRAAPLWFSYALFDFCFVIVIAIVNTIVMSQQLPFWFAVGNMFPVLLLYGLTAILLSYAISLIASSQLAAFAFAAGSGAVMFLCSLLGFILVNSYATVSGLTAELDGVTFGLNIIFPVGNLFRSTIVGFNALQVNCRNNEYVSSGSSIYAYGGPVLYLCLQICALSWFIIWYEGASLPSILRRKHDEDATEHDLRPVPTDVRDEKERVEHSDLDLLRVLGLTKQFGSNVAVDNISFGVSRGEVFALLGPNGAGKSTSINMIRGELRPDRGTILLENADIVRNMRAARKHLGVCPQFDALDLMTTREHLEFYASAKGVPAVKEDAATVMNKVGLEAYGNRVASKLSGGNKRKLSLAIALIGNPTVLVLDEPSSSMDAASKRIMWKTLTEVSANRALILTTHSMEEADALATRAGIISKRILALGTTDFLRKKYGNVYHIHLILKSGPLATAEEMHKVEQWVEKSFAGVRFDSFGSYHGQIKFSVPALSGDHVVTGESEKSSSFLEVAKIGDELSPESTDSDEDLVKQQPTFEAPHSKRSGIQALFSLLEENRENIGLEFYSVGATTLDQVFLNVVTENNVKEEGYAPAPGKKRFTWRCW